MMTLTCLSVFSISAIEICNNCKLLARVRKKTKLWQGYFVENPENFLNFKIFSEKLGAFFLEKSTNSKMSENTKKSPKNLKILENCSYFFRESRQI